MEEREERERKIERERGYGGDERNPRKRWEEREKEGEKMVKEKKRKEKGRKERQEIHPIQTL